MAKTLVNIISAQTIPNYVFIKDYYEVGDQLLFFTSSTMSKPLDYILGALGIKQEEVIVQSLSEENWEEMCGQIASVINPETKYVINTTGGTKYMSMAVWEEFRKHRNVDFVYIPNPKNIYLRTNENEIPIRHRVSIKEYLEVTKAVKYKVKHCTQSKEYVKEFFAFFLSFSLDDLALLEKVRRNFREQKYDIEDIKLVESQATLKVTNPGKKDEKRYCFEQIPNLSSFLEKIKFPFTDNRISLEEIEFLTGGWFEEYMYHLIEEKVQPDDIALGVFIKQTEETNTNDLDVVFTKGNKLFVIECKTAITKLQFEDKVVKGIEAMFKEISYKAATIKASLLGLPSDSIICSLSESDDHFKKLAQNMGIVYYDKRYFIDPDKQELFIQDILNKANV